MGWSEEMRRGALLAAMIADDSRLAAVDATLPEATAIRDVAVALTRDGDKRGLLRVLAAGVDPSPDPEASLSPRARALLSVRVPREIGEGWLAAAPRPRRGYRPPPGLARSLAHAAREGSRDAVAPDGEDLGEGRKLLAAALRTADETRRRTLLAGIGAGEAASLLALAAHRDDTPAPSASMVAAASVAAGDARVAALGAVSRGARERSGREAGDAMARAGRELAELGLLDDPEEP